MALWKESKGERQERKGNRVRNDLSASASNNASTSDSANASDSKSAASSEVENLIEDIEDLMARISDLKDADVMRVRGKVQRAVDATKESLAESGGEIRQRAREGNRQPTPTARTSSGLDAEHEEALNVEILRRRVQARAGADPDAAAFGWVARVGAALRRARDVRGLTQTVLSDGTNITQGYLSSLETGKLVRGPTVDVLYRYAAALACDCEITLRDRETGEVVTTVRSEPIESAAIATASGFYAEIADKMRT